MTEPRTKAAMHDELRPLGRCTVAVPSAPTLGRRRGTILLVVPPSVLSGRVLGAPAVVWILIDGDDAPAAFDPSFVTPAPAPKLRSAAELYDEASRGQAPSFRAWAKLLRDAAASGSWATVAHVGAALDATANHLDPPIPEAP